MRDEAHGAACKLRLNLPISNLATCYCGQSLEHDPWHILSHKGGGEAGRRHDEIVDRLVDAVQRAGGQAWSEPRQDFWQDRRRTDIYAVLGPKAYHIDVRVTHPTSVSYITVACQGPLRAAEAAAQEKRRRYAAMAHAEGATFVPFVIETFGGFGKDAKAFIADLARFASTTSQVWSAAETRFMVRAEVQRALFEGNLRVANAVLQESNPIRYASGRYHAVAPNSEDDSDHPATSADHPATSAATETVTPTIAIATLSSGETITPRPSVVTPPPLPTRAVVLQALPQGASRPLSPPPLPPWPPHQPPITDLMTPLAPVIATIPTFPASPPPLRSRPLLAPTRTSSASTATAPPITLLE